MYCIALVMHTSICFLTCISIVARAIPKFLCAGVVNFLIGHRYSMNTVPEYTTGNKNRNYNIVLVI